MDSGRRCDCRVFKIGHRSVLYRAIQHAIGFERPRG
jgi:hypothetical protein